MEWRRGALRRDDSTRAARGGVRATEWASIRRRNCDSKFKISNLKFQMKEGRKSRQRGTGNRREGFARRKGTMSCGSQASMIVPRLKVGRGVVFTSHLLAHACAA